MSAQESGPPNGFGSAAILAAGIGAFMLAAQVFSAGAPNQPMRRCNCRA